MMRGDLVANQGWILKRQDRFTLVLPFAFQPGSRLQRIRLVLNEA